MVRRARTPVVAGNWKMNGSHAQALEIVLAVREFVDDVEDVEKVVCPPFMYLQLVADRLRGTSILIGAQNCHWEDKGAYTGEVSPPMLKDDVDYVIVGHSERRAYFNETDETVNKKVKAVLRHHLRPIVCIGETGEQREAGETQEVLKRQLNVGLDGFDPPPGFIIAYEPVWAIGTGVAATPEMAGETIGAIRRQLESTCGATVAAAARILYGGSVTPDNFAKIMAQPEIDGGLVGGASLKADDFSKLVKIASKS